MIKSTNDKDYYNYSIGLDIGTSKICMMISQKDDNTKTYNLLGCGITESDGLNRGVVSNIDKVTNAIVRVLEQVENQSGHQVKEVVVGIAGDHIESMIQNGLITVSGGDSEISKSDVARLIDEVKKIKISADKRIIHTIPISYTVDNNYITQHPEGMSGVRLEADIMLVTALNSAINNLTRCIERAGLKLKEIVLEPIASSEATLTDEDKEMGVALVDIGGGTTDIAVFHEKNLKYTSVVAIGGKLITSDIRKVLGITEVNAESIKKEHGSCGFIHNDSLINIPLGGGNKPKEIMKSDLNEIIRARTIEMLQFVKYELVQSKLYDDLGSGVILTGGCALLDGISDLANEVLGLPVRIGIPKGFSTIALAPDISSPLFSTAVGLTLLGHKKLEEEQTTTNIIEEKKPVSPPLVFGGKGDSDIDVEEDIEENESSKNGMSKGKSLLKFFKDKLESM